MFYRLGKLVTRYRWFVVGFWLLAVVVALPFAPQVGTILQAGGFTSPDAESEQALTLLENKLHLNVNIVQIIYTSQRYSAYDAQFVREAQQSLASVQHMPEVASIISFTDNPRQISLDRRAAYVNVVLNTDPNTAPKLLPDLQRRLHPEPDLKTSIGGGAVFYQDIQTVSENDLRRAEALAFPFAVIALLLVFRSVVAAILPALVGGGAVLVSLALIFGLGHVTELSIFVLNITTLFGLGPGTNYPSGWQLAINTPQVQASLILQPELKNQELVVYQSTGNSYWEGAVSISGYSQGSKISGEGYVEMTGYAHP